MALPALPLPQVDQTLLPARSRLLAVIDEFPVEGSEVGGAQANRWAAGGVTWQPEPCLPLFTGDIDVCTRVDFTDFPRTCEPAITQTAFTVYDAFQASMLDLKVEEMEEILAGRVTRKLSAAFASELLTGAASGDRALRKDATAPTQRALSSAAAPIWYVLAVLEDELARRLRGTKGIIHLPPMFLAQAKATYGVALEGDRWVTPLGNLVIPDAGYIAAEGAGGQPEGGGGAAAAGQGWVYASGPVEFRMTEARTVDGDNIGSTITSFTGRENAAQSVFTSRNVSKRFRSLVGLLRWDPCPVTAALASIEQTDVV